MVSILVQIASYREHELVPTIESCLRHAANPQEIRFAIVNQFGPETEGQMDLFREDARFRIIEVPWHDARGLGVARRVTDMLHVDEEFYLQIDSHMRFLPNWDTRLLNQWSQCADPMAILSSYPPFYKYNESGQVIFLHVGPNRLVITEFHGKYAAFLEGIPLPGHPDRPVRGAFVAGGLQFGPGSVCKSVPAEPGIFFNGEEFVDSMRLFTHGYNIYSFVDEVVFHMYERASTQAEPYFIWKDFESSQDLKNIWSAMHQENELTLRQYALGAPDALGTVRSRRQFENFAGVDYAAGTVNPEMYNLPSLPLSLDDNWRSTAVSPSKITDRAVQ